MTAALARKEDAYLTVEEYFALEARSAIRHEYIDGEIYAMAGARRNHSLIASNLLYRLRGQLEGCGCEVHQSDLRVRVGETRYVYPDVVVAGAGAEWLTGESDTLLTPLVIFEVEVLAKSAANYRGEDEEFDYFALASLQEYFLVSHTTLHVSHYVRVGLKEWRLTIYDELTEEIFLPSLDCHLTMAQIYENVTLPPLKIVSSKKTKKGKQRD